MTAETPPVRTDSPSGTLIKHTGLNSNWCVPSELARVMKAIHDSAVGREQNWLGTSAKYTEIRVRTDMRTGHFVVGDSQGNRIDGNDDIMRKLGLGKGAFSPLDLVPTETTKYLIVESRSGGRRGLYTYRQGLDVGQVCGPDNHLVGFACNLVQAHGHMNSAVISLESSE